jgi:hypothetical protein
VIVDEDSGIIHFVHNTVQEYFERSLTFRFPDAKRDVVMMMTCTSYQQLGTFETVFCPTDEELEPMIRIAGSALISL